MPTFLIAGLLAAGTPKMLVKVPVPGTVAVDSDQLRARQARQRGEFVALEQILSDAQQRHPGELVEVELEGSTYEVEILRADGRLVELEYDARTGHWMGTGIDD